MRSRQEEAVFGAPGLRLARGFAAMAGLCLALIPTAILAQPAGIDLELNRLEPTDKGCMMSFVIRNGLASPIEEASYEMVLFNREGLVERLTVFNFGALAAGKTVVRQFELAGSGCEGIGRLLVNGAKSCKGEGLSADGCVAALSTSSKAGVALDK